MWYSLKENGIVCSGISVNAMADPESPNFFPISVEILDLPLTCNKIQNCKKINLIMRGS